MVLFSYAVANPEAVMVEPGNTPGFQVDNIHFKINWLSMDGSKA
jgi:hypothetical protein